MDAISTAVIENYYVLIAVNRSYWIFYSEI